MAATATSPIRIFETDHQPLRLIAEAQGKRPAEVVHAALLEYLGNHSEELSDVFAATQRAIAAGDLDALIEIGRPGAKQVAAEAAEYYAKL